MPEWKRIQDLTFAMIERGNILEELRVLGGETDFELTITASRFDFWATLTVGEVAYPSSVWETPLEAIADAIVQYRERRKTD